jgi:hypothetical protein
MIAKLAVENAQESCEQQVPSGRVGIFDRFARNDNQKRNNKQKWNDKRKRNDNRRAIFKELAGGP